MTALTPQQMRELADALTAEADYYESDVDCLENQSAAALRAAADQQDSLEEQVQTLLATTRFEEVEYRKAADQIEAVRAIAEVMSDMGTADEAALAGKVLAILTADTAPQEDRDE